MEDRHILLLVNVDGARQYQRCADEEAMCDALLSLCEADLVRRRGIADSLEGKPALAPSGPAPSAAAKAGADGTDEPTQFYGIVQYDAADLLNYVDVHLEEIVALQFLPAETRYAPHGRDWVKNRLYQQLLGMCQAGEDEEKAREDAAKAERAVAAEAERRAAEAV